MKPEQAVSVAPPRINLVSACRPTASAKVRAERSNRRLLGRPKEPLIEQLSFKFEQDRRMVGRLSRYPEHCRSVSR
jgi:hypothetical protein